MDFELDQALPLRLRSPADVITAVPPLLGFHPRDSLVLVSLAQEATSASMFVQFALRVDLPPPDRSARLVRYLSEVMAARRSEEILVVVVGGGGSGKPGEPPPHHELVEALLAECSLVGVPGRIAVWASEIAEDAPWRSYQNEDSSGQLPDPACAALAAEMVVTGQVIYADRADLEAVVAPGDPAVLAHRSDLLDAWLDEAVYTCRARPLDGPAAFELVNVWMTRARDGLLELTDDQVVALCLALNDVRVRDAAFGFALGGWAQAAERLWGTLVRECPDPDAAEPATLLAFSALVRGDTALATVALERAQLAWPGHRISSLLLNGLSSGIPPTTLRGWLTGGIEPAAVLLANDETR
jgi:hypothetical protein